MATLEHVELDALHAGMPVVTGGKIIGALVDVIPQPDGIHPLRLLTSREPDRRLVAIPIEWVRGIHDGAIELWVSGSQLEELPEYIPPLPVADARERVQRALRSEPATRGVEVGERDGTLQLRGTVADNASRSAASHIARSVPGVGTVRNLVSTRSDPSMSAAGLAYPWLHSLLERAASLDFGEDQVARVEDLAERKLVDMFDVAEDSASANGRSRVIEHDLPLTKGLQIVLLEVVDIAREFELEPLLVFLADAGIRTPMDEDVRSEVPRLMAALLMLIGRLVRLVESPDATAGPIRPTNAALDHVAAILDLIL